jgi:MFS family permease
MNSGDHAHILVIFTIIYFRKKNKHQQAGNIHKNNEPIIPIRLSIMMFLQFFIWGAWYVTMGTYLDKVLHATGVQVGAAYSAMAIATIFSPIFVGMIADRFFSAQKLLGVLHIVGAVLLYYITRIDNPSFFYWVVLLYSLMYAPTLALANFSGLPANE